MVAYAMIVTVIYGKPSILQVGSSTDIKSTFAVTNYHLSHIPPSNLFSYNKKGSINEFTPIELRVRIQKNRALTSDTSYEDNRFVKLYN